ncbi:DUF2971 domain-containing protein [Agrobacterium tumefaciens]|nr:DUF2971 domain-containing protein [Agrobacterium tumefaciens]
MQLYYYTPLLYGLMAISHRRLKISQFANLNDPADHVGLFVIRSEENEHLKLQRDIFNEQGGIICMSADWQNTMMWGHYADNHRGVCLVFDCDEDLWNKVDYRKDRRPSLREFGLERLSEMKEEHYRKLALMKSAEWSYEKEYRRFEPFDHYDFVNDIHFCPFDEYMQLKGILFGMRCGITLKQIRHVLNCDERIRAAYVRPSPIAYKMTLDGDRRKNINGLTRRFRKDEDGTLY